MPELGHGRGQRPARVVLQVDEADARALRRELGDELGPEAGRAAGDEGDLAAQARIRGELVRHGRTTARPTAPETRASYASLTEASGYSAPSRESSGRRPASYSRHSRGRSSGGLAEP